MARWTEYKSTELSKSKSNSECGEDFFLEKDVLEIPDDRKVEALCAPSSEKRDHSLLCGLSADRKIILIFPQGRFFLMMQSFFNKSNEMPSFSSPWLQCHLCLKLSLYAAQTAPYFENISLEVTLSPTLILLRATKDLRSGGSFGVNRFRKHVPLRSQIEGDDPGKEVGTLFLLLVDAFIVEDKWRLSLITLLKGLL